MSSMCICSVEFVCKGNVNGSIKWDPCVFRGHLLYEEKTKCIASTHVRAASYSGEKYREGAHVWRRSSGGL